MTRKDKTECCYCGREILRCRYPKGQDHFCNNTCRYSFYKENGKDILGEAHSKIRECGHYKRDNSYLAKMNKTKEHRESVSRGKMGKRVPRLQGKNHPRWKGGVDKGYWHTFEYQDWRRKVFERDSYKCQVCGDGTGGNLEAHHIKERCSYPELIFDIDNGITLCRECHRKTDNWGTKTRGCRRGIKLTYV